MKKIGLALLLAVVAVAISTATVKNASALPAFNKQWAETYKDSKAADAAKAEKCLLCHDKNFPKDKKKRNEYGMALSKFITKADYGKLKDDKEALTKKIEEAFTEAGKLKSSDGETFGAKIEAGNLPAAE